MSASLGSPSRVILLESLDNNLDQPQKLEGQKADLQKYPRITTYILSSLLITAGLTSIALSGISFAEFPMFFISVEGLWGSLLTVVAGGFGCAAARTRIECHVMTHLATTIIAGAGAAFVAWQIVAAILQAHLSDSYLNLATEEEGFRSQTSLVAIHISLLVSLTAQCAVSIWAASIGCRFICCRQCRDCCCTCYDNEQEETCDVTATCDVTPADGPLTRLRSQYSAMPSQGRRLTGPEQRTVTSQGQSVPSEGQRVTSHRMGALAGQEMEGGRVMGVGREMAGSRGGGKERRERWIHMNFKDERNPLLVLDDDDDDDDYSIRNMHDDVLLMP